MSIKSEKVIVLRTTKYGESDLILYALNFHGAKLSFFAKSALKSKKRFGGGVLEPTHYVQLNYKVSSNESGMHNLMDAYLLESFNKLRLDYERLQLALYVLGLIERVSQPETIDSEHLFHLLGNTLKAIESSSNLLLLKLHFELKLLAFQGVLELTPVLQKILGTSMVNHLEIQLSETDFKFLQNHSHHSLQTYLCL